jgi:hypothetical protein
MCRSSRLFSPVESAEGVRNETGRKRGKCVSSCPQPPLPCCVRYTLCSAHGNLQWEPAAGATDEQQSTPPASADSDGRSREEMDRSSSSRCRFTFTCLLSRHTYISHTWLLPVLTSFGVCRLCKRQNTVLLNNFILRSIHVHTSYPPDGQSVSSSHLIPPIPIRPRFLQGAQ